jgi:signal recognition particle GTPase
LAAGTAAASASAVTIDAQQALANLENLLLAGDISKQTHDTISKQLEDPKISQRRLDDPKRPPNVAAITGLILGSPEFQRR